ncbi:selenocysteine-specific translation elongation factor [Sansalvadorimonas verongulae]|uniref:selenocysteine-specific translation elongation factor n=1 Tax=Sansalvadorimonas verongulae TaxID=2172824 RepID=UPI0012BBEB32|nr:selenocysteine-specific translation elongation factor [Sansalvadorimonas verongulae]MTI13126.1 selenocysteine-specific translation elongation factor [Sansalvadorimonas verongulae]
MRAVIGTAGHVDHGKTALIKALTGIMTARAKEQKLGMTLDLGFAHFEGDNEEVVGVIDVPGHERYIRNMVSGVWSLDMVLLVVAADEGWMPMTNDHLKVIHAMGIKNLLVVINKSDAVDAETLELVEEDILERVMEVTGDIPESICVSALTGDNIPQLKKTILRILNRMEERQDDGSARIYLDRVFTVNGIGTVVTGSLTEGPVAMGEKLMVMPAGKPVQVKALQSGHKSLDEVSAVSRVAVGVKGITRKELERGHCLVKNPADAMVCEQMIVRLEEGFTEGRNNREVEVALGSAHSLARLHHIRGTRLARLVLTEKITAFWNQPFVVIRHGGSDLLFSGRVIWNGGVPAHRRAALYELLEALPEELSEQDRLQLSLDFHGYVHRDALAGCDGVDTSSFVDMSGWLVSHTFFKESLELVQTTLKDEGTALSGAELASKLGIEPAVLDQLLQELKKDNIIHMTGGAWVLGGGTSEDDLNQKGQQLLSMIQKAGKEGLQSSKTQVPGGQKELRNLVHLGFIVPMEDHIYYAKDVYDQCVEDILTGLAMNESFPVAHAKDRTGLSRKYLIPLLNRLERDGWVKRNESDRIVIKLLEDTKQEA